MSGANAFIFECGWGFGVDFWKGCREVGFELFKVGVGEFFIFLDLFKGCVRK